MMEVAGADRKDPILMYLYDRVLAGAISLYSANVPTRAIKFRLDASEFKNHSALPKVIESVREAHAQRRGPQPFLYPEGERLICSDDEIIVIAYQKLGIESIPAFILGLPDGTPAVITSSAATKEQARRLIVGERS